MSARNFNISLIVLLILSYLQLDDYLLSTVLLILTSFQLLYKIGKGIIMMEIIILISTLTYLIIPSLGYEVYNENSAIAQLWKKVMPIPKETYYDYFLPAILAFAIGLSLFFGNAENIDEGINIKKLVDNIKKKLIYSANTGVILSVIGITFFFITRSFGGLGYVGTLLYYTLYPGMMYIYFTPKNKFLKSILALDIAFVIFDALTTGMFTMVTYMGATMFSVFFIGKKIVWSKKITAFFLAIILIFVIQAVKAIVRKNKASANQFLVSKNATFLSIFTEEGFFPMYTRTNQGFIAAAVLRRIPEKQDFDRGSSLATSIGSAFVPRLFWPDKPMSGGIYNMDHYLGFKLKGYSMNVGPPAEAYGNFGTTGGVIFMFCFGLLLRFFYRTTLKVAQQNPLYILWLPIIFFQVLYCMENDVLQALNSVLKGSIFIYVLSKLMPGLFNISAKEQ